VPQNGQSLFDLLRLSDLDPNIIIEGSPMSYVEKIELNKCDDKKLRKHYVRCLESDFLSLTKLVKQQILSSSDNWDFIEIKSGHLPMATHSKWLANFLLSLASNKK
jgi:hypothetical protein